MADVVLEPCAIKSEPEWNNLLIPESEQRQYSMEMQNLQHLNNQNSTESLDIIENIDSDDNDFAEAESLTLIQFKKDERLCEFYRRMPILYDKSHPHYKFQSKKEKAWRELGRLVEMNVDQCKKRMTYFRCRFTVERRVIKNGVNCSEWPLLDKLKFLNKHIKIRRPRAGNDPAEVDTDDDNLDPNRHGIGVTTRKRSHDDTKDDLHAYLEIQHTQHMQHAQHAQQLQHAHAQQQYLQQQNEIQVQIQQQQQQLHMSQPVPVDSPIPSSNVEVSYASSAKKQRMLDMDDTSDFNLSRNIKYQQNLDHSINLDEHGAFGLYVGEVLKKLSAHTAALTSLKIMQLLFEAQTTPSNNNNSKNTNNISSETNGN